MSYLPPLGDEEDAVPLHRGVRRVRELQVVLAHLLHHQIIFSLQKTWFFQDLRIFVKEVFEVFRKVNDPLFHLGDAAPPVKLNFPEELWVVCHLEHFFN